MHDFNRGHRNPDGPITTKLDLTKNNGYSMASSSPQPAAPSLRNPVALRLYKILGTNFDDEGTVAAGLENRF